MTALLTDEEVIEAARSHAQEETKLMHDSTERDEHLEYAERDFEAGARFARDHYEAALQRERIVRQKLEAALMDAMSGLRCVQQQGTSYGIGFDRVETNGQAALAAAKEME